MRNRRIRGCQNYERLEQEVAELKARIEMLEALLAAATRRGKRQAAPFSKGTAKRPVASPARTMARIIGRAVPESVDKTHDVPLPCCCPNCGVKPFQNEHICAQFQFEIPRRPVRLGGIATGCYRRQGCR